MKVEIELNQKVIAMLERYRAERIKYQERWLEKAKGNKESEYLHRSSIEEYQKASLAYLAEEYLRRQTYSDKEKTD